MTRLPEHLALCARLPFELAHDGAAPEWVQLLPAGRIVETHDERGPYSIVSLQAIATASLKAGDKLPIAVNHSIDLASPSGGESPAQGWIVEMQEREGAGLWGRVEWTDAGRAKVANREYRGISPVIQRTKGKQVLAVLRASLTNTPNLKGLLALHSENHAMDWKAKLIELLGLGGDAADADINSALTAKIEAADKPELNSQQGVDLAAVQTELSSVTTKYNDLHASHTTLQDTIATDKATAFVDGAIRDGRVGVKPMRQKYIDMHKADPAGTAELIGAMPKLSGSQIVAEPPADAEATELNAVDLASQATVYQRKQADAGVQIDFASAVLAVKEGKHK